MKTPMLVEAHWDEPWRSVTTSHWRYLGLVLSPRPVSGTPELLDVVVTMRFWADGIHVMSVVHVPGANEAPRLLTLDGANGSTSISVRVTSNRPTLIVAVLKLDKLPGLATATDVSAGEVTVGMVRDNNGEDGRRALELTQAISRDGPVNVAVFAVGAAADLATRDVEAAQLAWIAAMLDRCEQDQVRDGLWSDFEDIVRSAGVCSRDAGNIATRAARVASDLASELWPSIGVEQELVSSEAPSGVPYDLREEEFDAAGRSEHEETRPTGEAPEPSVATRSPLSVLRDDEWRELERRFCAVCESVGSSAAIRAQVAGITVWAHLDLDHFPRQPPVLRTSPELTHRLIRPAGVVSRLISLRHWNRTLGLPHVLMELEGEWGQQPPQSLSGTSFWIRVRNRILSLSR